MLTFFTEHFFAVKIHKDLRNFNVVTPVVTVGIFDGVHLGHITILNRLKNLARKVKGETVIITFWPHPRMALVSEGSNLKYLNTLAEKQILLDRSGIDHLVIIPFTKELSHYSAREFIKKILVDMIGVKYLVVGYNHKFGKNRQGDFQTLFSCSEEYHFTVEQLDAKIVDEEKVSSTKIREALLSGRIKTANSFLGYDYFLNGTIVAGKKIGRSIGFPTVNVLAEEDYKMIPRDGVYAVELVLDGKTFRGMLNAGVRPTVNSGGEAKSIEVHIFNFDQEIYGQDITLIFKQRIRDEKMFENMEALAKQLKLDKQEALKILAKKNSDLYT
ncbi:Bifunctional riboflavin kinase/FMN adenylyltransferase [subsurface metagenome]